MKKLEGMALTLTQKDMSNIPIQLIYWISDIILSYGEKSAIALQTCLWQNTKTIANTSFSNTPIVDYLAGFRGEDFAWTGWGKSCLQSFKLQTSQESWFVRQPSLDWPQHAKPILSSWCYLWIQDNVSSIESSVKSLKVRQNYGAPSFEKVYQELINSLCPPILVEWARKLVSNSLTPTFEYHNWSTTKKLSRNSMQI